MERFQPVMSFSPALTINPNKIPRAITWQDFQSVRATWAENSAQAEILTM
jgi:hypothetical protein